MGIGFQRINNVSSFLNSKNWRRQIGASNYLSLDLMTLMYQSSVPARSFKNRLNLFLNLSSMLQKKGSFGISVFTQSIFLSCGAAAGFKIKLAGRNTLLFSTSQSVLCFIFICAKPLAAQKQIPDIIMHAFLNIIIKVRNIYALSLSR